MKKLLLVATIAFAFTACNKCVECTYDDMEIQGPDGDTYGDYIQEFTAGLRLGFSYSNNSNMFNLGFQDLGAAGYSTSFSFSKIIL